MILVDTAPVVALCDPRDGLHDRALRDLDRLARRPLALCTPVLTEACFLLDQPMQRRRLRQVVADLQMNPLTPNDAASFRTEVFTWLERYAEHEPDWADGYLAVAAGRDRRATVWTYDREFRTIWRRPDGTRIPLAVR